MQRLLNAFRNSVRAAGYLLRTETAFQQEAILLVLALLLGWFVSSTWPGYALLVSVVLVLILVEVLNTAVEATCNAISRESNIDIRLAKDCGSLAVLITSVLTAGVWLIAVVERITGAPI